MFLQKNLTAMLRISSSFGLRPPTEMQQQQHPASALTNLATLVITASNDPRRHPISFHLYRISFGSDPASLPQVEFTGAPNQAQSQSADAPLSTGWGDWQSAYHWASLILQGRAPPPPGIGHLLPGEQRAAATSQSAAAYRVFVHLANQGHPRGIFGIGRHLLSTLERGSDPTALGAISLQPRQPLSRQETIAEVERLYRLAGEGGVEEAWFQLGALYAEGKWVRKDDARARGFLEEGVERNSPRACQALSQLLTRESQAPQAPSSLASASDSNIDNAGERQERLLRSLQLLEQGAKFGFAECAFSAGMRYLLQPATPTTNDSADHQSASLDLSLDPSSTSSKPQVDPIQQARRDHKQKWGIEADDEAASRWLRMAADGGSAMAMMNLARMYLEGRVVPSSSSTDGSTATDSSSRKAQLIESSNLYAKILARAMGPEGQRAKALAEVQAKMAQQSGKKADPSKLEPGLGVGSGRLDDLGVRAEEGLRLVREELAALGQS